jgi:hypothetical protein
VKEKDPPGSYKATVKRMTLHFYTLEPIMRDRANATCIVNSDVFCGVLSEESNSSGGDRGTLTYRDDLSDNEPEPDNENEPDNEPEPNAIPIATTVLCAPCTPN